MLIAHATDLTGDDDSAFVHAAALAAAAGATLVTIHGNPAHPTTDLPDAAALAARWGRQLVHVRRCHDCCDDAADTVLDALQGLRADLVVVGTHGRHGLGALARASIAEAIARNVDTPVLVVPNRARRFADAATGAIDLRRIVIPAGTGDDARRGIAAAQALIALAGLRDATLELVHVGDDDPAISATGVAVTRARGRLEAVILDTARAREACVIVMPTRRHDGIADVLLGSHTERVIREAPCAVLSVPFSEP